MFEKMLFLDFSFKGP